MGCHHQTRAPGQERWALLFRCLSIAICFLSTGTHDRPHTHVHLRVTLCTSALLVCGHTDAGANGDNKANKSAAYIVDVLVNCKPGSAAGVGPAKAPRLLSAAVNGIPLVVPFPLEQVSATGQMSWTWPGLLKAGSLQTGHL